MNIVLAGVGGNGIVLVSRMLAECAMKEGIKARLGEKHGLAQRGGTVTSHLRLGNDAMGVVIPEGKGDLLLGFEPLEALRCMKLMKPKATAIINTIPHKSPPHYIGLAEYPDVDKMLGVLESNLTVRKIDASAVAAKTGNKIMANIVMLGALVATGALPIKKETVVEVIRSSVPKGTEEKNVEAFEAGYKLGAAGNAGTPNV